LGLHRAACVVITIRLLGKHRYGEPDVVLMTATAVSTIAVVSLPLAAARYVSRLRLSGSHRVMLLLKVLVASAFTADPS